MRVMPKTTFKPEQHGYHFANFFENVILEESPMGKIATRGRCGGMAFSALDHFYSGLQLPKFTSEQLAPKGVPPDSHPLAKYIYRRQLDSFFVLSGLKYITWSLSPDSAGFLVKGVSRWTKEDEWQKLADNIDRGKPVTLGLIAARDLAGLTSNHQVIAYGYAIEGDARIVHIYDVNYPDEEIQLRSDSEMLGWFETSRTKESWRGWFVQDYAPILPPPDISLPLPSKKGISPRKKKLTTLTVAFETLTFYNPEAPSKVAEMVIDFDIDGESWRYPQKGVRKVKHGTKVKLDKIFEVGIPKDGELNIRARVSRVVSTTNSPEFDAYDFFHLDNDSRAGEINDRYTATGKWGKGKHSARSSGSLGGFVLDYKID
jgi:hypothetical protein